MKSGRIGWPKTKELSRRLVHLEKCLLSGFNPEHSNAGKRFSRSHLNGALSEEPESPNPITLSPEFRVLFRERLIRPDCFQGARLTLTVSHQGTVLEQLDLAIVGAAWKVVGRPQSNAKDAPDIPLLNAPQETPLQLFKIRRPGSGYQVQSASSRLTLFDPSNAEAEVIDISGGDHFRIGGLEFSIGASKLFR